MNSRVVPQFIPLDSIGATLAAELEHTSVDFTVEDGLKCDKATSFRVASCG